MAICGITTSTNGIRTVSVKESGYAFDMRPGASVDNWKFTNTYAWPKANKVYGTAWDIGNMLPSPVTLMPAVLDPAWETEQTDKGPYARNKLVDYVITEGTWDEYPRLHPKDYVIVNKSGTGSLKSVKPLPANRGLTVFFRVFGPTLLQKTILEIKFGSNTDAKVFTLNINADGKGYLSRGAGPTLEKLAEGDLVPNRWGGITNDWHKIFILPHGRNRILITSSTGGSFMWQDKNIPRTDPGNIVPPLVPTAFFHVTAYQKVAHQVRPIAYKGTPSGSTNTRKAFGLIEPGRDDLFTTFRNPDLTSLNKILTYDRLTQEIKPSDVTVTFTKNTLTTMNRYGLKPSIRLQRPDVAEEDIFHTPFFFRVEAGEQPINQSTVGEPGDLFLDVIEFSHTQDQKALSGSIKIKNAHNHGQLKNMFNIPFEWKEGPDTWLKGILTKPTHTVKGNQQFIQYDIQDMQRWLDNTFVADLNRLDGMAIDEAVKALLIAVGFPKDGSMWDIDESPSYVDRMTGIKKKTLKLSKGEADDEPTNLTDVVKTVSDWLEYICNTYTSSGEYPFRWVYGWRPYPRLLEDNHTIIYEWRFYFLNPDKFSLTPVKSFWPTTELALAAIDTPSTGGGGATIETAYRSVHQNMTGYLIEPEFNALQCVGMDELQKPIIWPIEDSKSIDATLVYNNQPANWLGEKRYVAYVDSSLNTKELVVAAAGKLFKRGSRTRKHIEFNAEWEPTVRVWDLVRIKDYLADGVTLTTHDYRIIGFKIDHRNDCNQTIRGQYIHRPASYIAERWYNTREI